MPSELYWKDGHRVVSGFVTMPCKTRYHGSLAVMYIHHLMVDDLHVTEDANILRIHKSLVEMLFMSYFNMFSLVRMCYIMSRYTLEMHLEF